MTDAESMATALGHSPLFACGGHGHARRGGEGGNLRFFIRAHDQATHAPWRPYCSLHSGGGHTVGATTPAPLEQADFGGRSGWKGVEGSETASDAEANRGERPARGEEATVARHYNTRRTAYIVCVCVSVLRAISSFGGRLSAAGLI